MKAKEWTPFLIAILATLPGVGLRLAETLGLINWYAPEAHPYLMAVTSGVAVLGASFLLLWACDAAQADISQALAIAVVALIAVLPEYAVDMYFTWQAGKHPDTNNAQLAIANMTGANRLLIGVAWGVIALVQFWRFRRDVRLEPARRLELLFLGMATTYAFVIPIKGTLAWYDGVVFLGIYGWYIYLAGKRPAGEGEAEGPAEVIVKLPKLHRRMTVIGMFLFAAVVILANADPFCEGLVQSGTALGINQFLLVQWLAPVASEAPEFTVALVFAWRGMAGAALGSLLSAKLNQWTLLVGMIPGVFALAHGTIEHPIPMGSYQMHEILLTAAQSLLAVVVLTSMRFSLSSAILLFMLFVGQLVAPYVLQLHPDWAMGVKPEMVHAVFSLLYVVAAMTIIMQAPGRVVRLWRGTQIEDGCTCDVEPKVRRLWVFVDEEAVPVKPRGASCESCPLRSAAMKTRARRVEA